ncbi:MAG: hypothetical protein VX092_06340, partial [SAR324 cluster bacterium]|nr:hypothetical protein [SAR324 cluster bacterium]
QTNPYHQKLFCVKHTTNRNMIQKIGQGKPWRWVVISAGVVLGGYLLISLLGAILGLAFAAGTLLGGAWLFQRIWNQWKTRQIDESSNPPKKEDQNLETELANLKAKMKPDSED